MKNVSSLALLGAALICVAFPRAEAAIIPYAVNTVSGDSWTGVFDISNPSATVTSLLPTSISGPSGTFSPSALTAEPTDTLEWQVIVFPNLNYLTFYSEPFYSAVSGGVTWDGLLAAGSYPIDKAIFSTGGFIDAGSGGTVTFGSAPVPEPGTWAAAALLLGGAGLARWRRRGA